jgi:hypothetical protein
MVVAPTLTSCDALVAETTTMRRIGLVLDHLLQQTKGCQDVVGIGCELAEQMVQDESGYKWGTLRTLQLKMGKRPCLAGIDCSSPPHNVRRAQFLEN